MKNCIRFWADLKWKDQYWMRNTFFAKVKIMSVGHSYTSDQIAPDPSKLRAILDMPQPSCRSKEGHGYNNLPGQSYATPGFIHVPKKICWQWMVLEYTTARGLSETEEGAQFKASVSSILTHETRLSADDSLFGLEGVLTQKQPENGLWKPVVYIYWGFSEAEKHYAQIGKEALAAMWACFTLETYHKPLVFLMSTKALDQLPP